MSATQALPATVVGRQRTDHRTEVRLRRHHGPPLTPEQAAYGCALEQHLHHGYPDHLLAQNLGVTLAHLTPILAELRIAAARLADHHDDGVTCERTPRCRHDYVCPWHLRPLQDWWDTRDTCARALTDLPSRHRGQQ